MHMKWASFSDLLLLKNWLNWALQDASKTASYNIASRLKTPLIPLWVTSCNGTIGMLYIPNKDILKTHHAEKRLRYIFNVFDSSKLSIEWLLHPLTPKKIWKIVQNI